MTKYGKYILTEQGGSQATAAGVRPVVLEGLKDWAGVRLRMDWKFVTKAGAVMDTPHRHAFDEFLVFLSCTPADELNFDADIELSFGAEGEKQVISAPAIVCLPQGLVHGPLVFRRVGKPVLFNHIYLAPDYQRLPA